MSRVRIRKRPDEPADMKQAYLVLHARYQNMKKELAQAKVHYKTVLDFLEEHGYIEYKNDGDVKFQTDIKYLKDPPRRLSDYALMEIYDQVTTRFMLKVVFNWCMKHLGKIVFFVGLAVILIYTKVQL
jgi:hypothetical protein